MLQRLHSLAFGKAPAGQFWAFGVRSKHRKRKGRINEPLPCCFSRLSFCPSSLVLRPFPSRLPGCSAFCSSHPLFFCPPHDGLLRTTRHLATN